MAEGVVWIGSKGGVGTSSSAVLCAAAVAARGEPVALVDLTGDAAPLLGLDDARAGLSEVLRGTADLAEVVAQHPSGITVVPRGSEPIDPEFDRDALGDAWRRLGGDGRALVADAGSGDDAMDLTEALDATRVLLTSCCAAASVRAQDLADKADSVAVRTDSRWTATPADLERFLGRPIDAVVASDPVAAVMGDSSDLARHGLDTAADLDDLSRLVSLDTPRHRVLSR